MPYEFYRALSDEDARSIVVYLRSSRAIESPREKTELQFPVSAFVKFLPQPLDGPVPEPNKNDPVAYGKYLAEIAGCRGCHTPVDSQRRLVPGKDFAGGQPFPIDIGLQVLSTNLTPDRKTGIGKLTKEAFIGRFKSFEDRAASAVEVPPDRNTVMPWLNFARMRVEDLSAIYDYLQTVPPIENRVRTVAPPKMTKTSTAS
jgi:hypothetical protein